MKNSMVSWLVYASIGIFTVSGCIGQADSPTEAVVVPTQGDPSVHGWLLIAPGVYQKTDSDGSTTRIAYGNEGAAYDRARLRAKIELLEAKDLHTLSVDDQLAELANAKTALAGIPLLALGEVTTSLTSSGTLCGRYGYYFDSQLAVGGIGVAEVARVIVSRGLVAPLPPTPTSTNIYASATLANGSGMFPTTESASTTTFGTRVAVVNDKPMAPLFGSSACVGSTFSYVQIDGGLCTSTSYVSQSKTYSSCVSSL